MQSTKSSYRTTDTKGRVVEVSPYIGDEACSMMWKWGSGGSAVCGAPVAYEEFRPSDQSFSYSCAEHVTPES